ncbi:MAG: sugar ABC transporter substrate-binding protein, partial [Gemmatimonadaceae bacterium]
MKTLKVVLALITRDNDYQREQASVAEETAKRLGIDLQVIYADSDAIEQTKMILAAIRKQGADKPDAIIAEPVGTGMPQVAKSATENGIGWVVLNRDADYLAPLRESASVPIGSINNDNTEIGRIQGQQFAALLPIGGKVLYIEGPATEVSKQRRAGLAETVPANIEIKSVRGKWTEESGFQAVSPRLPMQTAEPPNVDLFGSQNDAMAMGARRAVEALPVSGHREQWLKIPFTGCDGVPTSGQLWVKEKKLAATVVSQALTG